ncbi:hypothetical protein [Portibacter marinus]|uniref:hypothetical protein n=1 Tax=Portibacter marinus TaxID=2898660 RepID=UPI001F2884C6|nr:hypothetical protein [Portibacter marinus]
MNILRLITVTLLMSIISQKSIANNHIIPDEIKDEALKALSYYPELQDANIEFRFKDSIKQSTMQARPKFSSFFKHRRDREYVILISKVFKISGKRYLTKDLPRDVMIGWLGHELGHIMDYQNRSRYNLIAFGVKYLFVDNHIMRAERAADGFAIRSGMEKYILKTKQFILNHADIDEKYVARIKKYYLSPEEIMEMVRIREEKMTSSAL